MVARPLLLYYLLLPLLPPTTPPLLLFTPLRNPGTGLWNPFSSESFKDNVSLNEYQFAKRFGAYLAGFEVTC